MENTMNKGKGKNVLAAGLVGAAVTVASIGTAVVLSKKENRKKAKKIFNNLKRKGQELTEKAGKTLNQTAKQVRHAQKRLKKIAGEPVKAYRVRGMVAM